MCLCCTKEAAVVTANKYACFDTFFTAVQLLAVQFHFIIICEVFTEENRFAETVL